jgi:hypothetical protein
MSAEDFLGTRKKKGSVGKKTPPEPEISYTQMHKINEELRRLWLS